MGNPTFLTPEQREALLDIMGWEPAHGGEELEAVLTGRGADFGSAEQNALVEAAATRAVHDALEADNWVVSDVSRDRVGWDSTARRGEEELHIEIKGVSSDEIRILLTRHEHDVARYDEAWQLWIVTSALSDPSITRVDRERAVAAALPFV